MRLDLLILAPEVPYPPRKGTAMRNYNIIRNLGSRHRVRLLAFDGDGVGGRELEASGLCERVLTVAAPHRPGWRRLVQLLCAGPDLALRLESAPMMTQISQLVRADPPDIVQLEGLETARLWQEAEKRFTGRRPLVVLDEHNAEYALQERAFQTDIRRPVRWPAAAYSWLQAMKLRRYESALLNHVDGVVAVSEADAGVLRQLPSRRQAVVVSNGVDTDYFCPGSDDSPGAASSQSETSGKPSSKPLGALEPPALVFTGTMDYRPNVDAAVWMSRTILPLIRNHRPNARLYLVGQRPSPAVRELSRCPGVHVTGAVEDVRPFIAGASVYVVPMRYGGGVRLKVLEAMAMGRAVVATRMGLDGIDCVPGQHVVVADEAEPFAAEVVSLLSDPERRQKLGSEARRLVCESYDWRTLVPRLEEYYLELLEKAKRRPRQAGRGGAELR